MSALRNRDVDLLDEFVDDHVASLRDLREGLGLLDLFLDVGLQLFDGVELAGDLREVVVGLGKFPFLDGEQGHGDERFLAGAVAADQRRLEGGRLARGKGIEGFIDALDELARSDLVADVVRGVDLLVTDGGDEVELGEVAGLGRTVDRDERTETAAQVIQLILHIVGGDRDRVDLELQALIVGDDEVWVEHPPRRRGPGRR